MFIIEYRTVSRLGAKYPIRVATVGIHRAATEEQAGAHILSTTPNVEVISVRYQRVGA